MKNIISTLALFCLINCTLIAQNTISGQVNCLNGASMEGVIVNLSGGTIGTLSVVTDQFGNYTFNNIPSSEDYTIFPEKDGIAMNGVSIFDMVTIRDWILGYFIGDPLLLLAADVNDSGSVTTFDIVQIQKVILQIEDSFSASTWTFATEDFDFSTGAGYAGSVPVLDLQGDLIVNFVGVHRGDMNGSSCN